MTSVECIQKKNCRICNSSSLEKVVQLTPSPPGNNFLRKEQIKDLTEEEFPLELHFCNSCYHIQLGHVVDPSFIFQNGYSYVSSTSKVFVNHLKEYSNHIEKMLQLKRSSFVVDIGSNDGTCLKFFRNKGMRVLGVDPATDIAAIATSKGIETIDDFFSLNLAKQISNNYGKADLITSHNACAHIDDLRGVIQGVESLLKNDGIFVMEVGYFVDVYTNSWFDTIYHEHVDFHTVAPLEKLFDLSNMELIRVERISPQGGSIRVFVQKKDGLHPKHKSVDGLIKLEKSLGLNLPQTLKDFEIEINRLKEKFLNLILNIKREGKSIAAFGAPTKATTLCYHFGIEKKDIDFIVDDNPLKQGLFSPGKHIPVYAAKRIYDEKPDYLLILAWNFAESIMKNHKKYLEEGGLFILPMPEPLIVGAKK